MKTILATTTALLVAAASPAIAGEKMNGQYKNKTTAQMDGKVMMSDETMDVGMQPKTEMEMQTASSMDAPQDDLFGQIDTNASGDVDFTEFSNYMETKGYDVADSAKEYVKLTSDSNGVITDRSFAGVDIANMPHKHLDDGTTHNMGMTQSASTVTTPSQTAVMGSTATTDFSGSMSYSSNYGTFGDYDMNADGNVDFNEYRKARSKAGITTTAAAQEFIRFTDGQTSFDQLRFDQAASDDVLNREAFRVQYRN